MKEILPVLMWNNGQQVSANYFKLQIISDNLSTNAQFFYALYSILESPISKESFYQEGVQLTSGNLNITGEAYDLWEQNQYAWDWAAAQLNLTFAPIVESTTTTTVAPEVNVPGTIN